ncbi:YCF48-related protein [Algoriphagus boritolerans]|uniref:YCF48-related protein n=1 Tax=Algoriphagus boritolerans TaxID=308111 RepID=UPI002FCE031C
MVGKIGEKYIRKVQKHFFDGISFLDKERGFILGDPVGGNWMILETSDGGKSWKTMENLPPAEIGEAAFAASASSLVAFELGLIFGTGGLVSNLHFYDFKNEDWEKIETPILQGEASQGIFALAKTKTNLLAVGGDYTKLDGQDKNAFRFSNQSYELPVIPPLGYRSGIAYLEKDNLIIAVGPSGSDYSRDEGKIWKNFSTTGYHAAKISCHGETAWASGSNGRVAVLFLR